MTEHEKKILRFPNLSAIEAEAANWVARLDHGEMSIEERAQHEVWQHRSVQHAEALERMHALWSELDDLGDLATGESAAPTAANRPWRASAPALRGLLAAAAVLLVALFAGTPLLGFFGPPASAAPEHYETAVGAQRRVALADGSSILLNTDSAVEVRFSPARRDIRLLRGEAYFEVAPNKARPFSVFAGEGMVRAVGTAFAVRLNDQQVDVTVTKGKVELASLPSSALAQPIPPDTWRREVGMATAGQDAVFGATLARLASVPAVELDRKLAWRHGVLAFNGQPLAQVVADISRYTNVRIEIEDPRLKSLRIGGYFQIGQVDAMLESLEDGFNVRVVRAGPGLVRLYPAT